MHQKFSEDISACVMCVYLVIQQADASQIQAAAAEKKNWWPTEVVNEHLKRFTKKQ